MKNWGKFFILTIILITFAACGEKGSGGGVAPNPNVPKDSAVATEISVNAAYVNNMIGSSNSYKQRTYLSQLLIELNKLFTAYEYGNTSQSDVTTADKNANNYSDLFFEFNEWLGYDQIVSTNSKLQYHQQNIGIGTDANIDIAVDIFNSKVTSIDGKLLKNKHYIEMEESESLNSFLNSNTTTDVTFRQYLKNLGLLDDESLSDKYANLARLVQRDINLLNDVGTVASIDLLTIANPITDFYHTNGSISDTNKQKILAELNNLYNIYLNYQNYSTDDIIKAEATFNSIDFTTFNESMTNSLTYYLVRPTNGGNNLEVLVSTYAGLATDLITELKDIYSNNDKLSPNEKDRLYKLIKNLEHYKSMIEDFYSMITPVKVYSKTVISMQFTQILLDNKDFILTVRNIQ